MTHPSPFTEALTALKAFVEPYGALSDELLRRFLNDEVLTSADIRLIANNGAGSNHIAKSILTMRQIIAKAEGGER